MKNCPHCNGPVNDSDKFCANCGKTLSSGTLKINMGAASNEKRCAYCGAAIHSSAGFCSKCGKSVNGTESHDKKTEFNDGTKETFGGTSSPPPNDFVTNITTISLVLSIVSLVILFIPYIKWLALPLAAASLVLAVKSSKECKALNIQSNLTTAAFIIGLIVVIITGIYFISCGLCTLCLGGATSSLLDSLSRYQ